VKRHFLPALLIFMFAVSSCSININQPPVSGPPKNSNVPWGDLNLSGMLVYNIGTIEAELISTSVQSLDLVTGEVQIIFQAPEGGWVDAVTVSPDATLMIMSYSPSINTGMQTALYSMPLDGSQPPQLLFPPPTDKDQYAQPYWSPDGRTIYFAHINYGTSPTYDIMRMAYPGGTPETLIESSSWPRPSDDGSRLVYVALDPESGANSLFVSYADGTDARQVPVTGLPVPMIIDAPMFSADQQSIIFSSPLGIPASAPNLLDKIMGVSIALANGDLISDWWSVPSSGGKATQLTKIGSSSLYGNYSPDKKYIASYSAGGIFVMKPDGTEVTMVVRDVGGISGTVCWLP
jgi:Tol biopolymer transport system component